MFGDRRGYPFFQDITADTKEISEMPSKTLLIQRLKASMNRRCHKTFAARGSHTDLVSKTPTPLHVFPRAL